MLLSCDNLGKKFGRHAVISSCSFSLDKGGCLFLTGPSGSGKTTLLAILAGILKPDTGSVTIEDRNLYELDDNERSRLRRDFLAFMPQETGLLPSLSLLDNVRIGEAFGSRKLDNGKKALEMLHKVGLDHHENDRSRNLSGGERRRAALARCLFQNPVLLLADEPTSNLDRQAANVITAIFQDLNRNGTTLVITSHDEHLIQSAFLQKKIFEVDIET